MNETPFADSAAYHEALREALDDTFLRSALDKFAVDYRSSRAAAFAGLNDKALIARVAECKDYAAAHMDALYARFKAEAEARGVTVHRAATAAQANAIILGIAKAAGCRSVVKAKSMTAEEIGLNQHLEAAGLTVTETDLGEWIVQLRHEGPSHMVIPAIHLSRGQVADLFGKVTGVHQEADITRLVRVARRRLRRAFATADMGFSGVNVAVAESGVLGTVTNEGNLRLVTTLPRVHVALCGLDKLVPSFDEALSVLQVLPRNATGQVITSYVTWIGGANPCATAPGGVKEMHVVFLDNGRTSLASDPAFSPVLRCVRCGACANVCPVFRLVGGHRMGYIYIGAIGLLLTYFFHGRDKARLLVNNCIGCEACKDICAGGIDLPALIRELRVRLNSDGEQPFAGTLMSAVMKNRRLFHALLKFGKYAQRPVTGGTAYIRHLPQMFMRDQGFRALPALAGQSFREGWPALQQELERLRGGAAPTFRVALFGGCAQDFIYPEQLAAAARLLARHGVELEFPLEQTCCGLPLEGMGQREASLAVARQNLAAFDPARYDAVLTLCASCASHLRHGISRLPLEPEERHRARRLEGLVVDFSSFVRDTLGLSAADTVPGATRRAAWHGSCHLCRGLGVTEAPRALLGEAYTPTAEEEVCCGFGGTYSVKFPEVSAALLRKKLQTVAASGATHLVADCPGCVMQLRGGAEAAGLPLRVCHMAEWLTREGSGAAADEQAAETAR